MDSVKFKQYIKCNPIYKNSDILESVVTLETLINQLGIDLILHRPERKMRQNAVMTYISYNYVSNNSLNVLL